MVREKKNKRIDISGNKRAGLLKKLPWLADVLPAWEEMHGTLIQGGSAGVFKDGRFVMLFQFERAYLCVFYNPHNADSPETDEQNFVLSPEAMCALTGLYHLFGDKKRDGDAYLANLKPRD